MTPRIGLTKDKVIQTAIFLVDTKGVENVTIATVAKQLNIKPPSLYNHVDGLTEIYGELALEGLNRLYGTLSNASKNKSSDVALHSISVAYVSFVRAHPGLYEMTIKAPAENEPERRKVADNILQLVLKILSTYQITEQQALHQARALRSLLHGFATLEQQGGFGLPQHVDESLNVAMNTYINGLKNMD
ncbi:TetR/AcrR family transcriptional regulator [Bacillus alkalicellulosilyticus]|uniref:TetR/AcrR family transcriptional regulator n=1 Tax=Alkalihalobacterium alkalicellulosilyticum TaxID=1912214 RepID=UPI0009980267|nr:TetR/AcrR family transcriptional regulator [Bacillus alkalicellulosilyticus]